MSHFSPDTQLINALAAAIEPAVVKAVERTVRDVLQKRKYSAPPEAPKPVPRNEPRPTIETAPPEKRLLSVKEVAAFLSVSKATVYVMMERGDLPSVKFGRCRRFWLADVERLVGTAE